MLDGCKTDFNTARRQRTIVPGGEFGLKHHLESAFASLVLTVLARNEYRIVIWFQKTLFDGIVVFQNMKVSL